MIFPLWHISPNISRRIKTSRILFGILVGTVILPSMFVIIATVLNIIIGFGHELPEAGSRLFYHGAQTLPFGLIGVITSTPFCFFARHSGFVGLVPMQMFGFGLLAVLASALWIGQLITFSAGSTLILLFITALFSLIQWLIMWFTCILPLGR